MKVNPLATLHYIDVQTCTLQHNPTFVDAIVRERKFPFSVLGSGLDMPLTGDMFNFQPVANSASSNLFVRSLCFLLPLIDDYEKQPTEDNRLLTLDICQRFLDYMADKMDFKWYDSVEQILYIRTVTLLKVLHTFPMENSLQESLLNFLKQQEVWIDNYYSMEKNNHGTMQCFGHLYYLVFIGNRNLDKPLTQIKACLDIAFDADGFCTENTIAYQQINLFLFEGIVAFCEAYAIAHPILTAIKEKIVLATQVFKHVIMNPVPTRKGGIVPPIGDAGHAEMKSLVSLNGTKAYPICGFFVHKTDDIYLSFKCGMVEKSHKHVDDTSITLRYKDQAFFVDCGLHDYDYTTERYQLLTSAKSHSGVFPESLLTATAKDYKHAVTQMGFTADISTNSNNWTVSGYYIDPFTEARISRTLTGGGGGGGILHHP